MKALRVLAVTAALSSLLLASGCSLFTPTGYDADTTPGHNGETWVGGEEYMP